MTAIDWGATIGEARERGDGGAQVGRWAMTLFLINEGTLFACLVASYFYLDVANRVWPPREAGQPSLPIPLTMTALLLSSSAVLVFAERAFVRGSARAYRVGVGLTIALGIGFLSLQSLEYADKLHRMRPSDSSYASLFYTITGLHGAHVAFGLLFLLWALLREVKRTAHPPKSLAITNASWYWHFVDGVWLVILTTLYLSPRLSR